MAYPTTQPIRDEGMWIRDTKCNNMTLLAKTQWRISKNENLLCSKVLKAKYSLIKLCERRNIRRITLGSKKVITLGSKKVVLML